LLGDLFKWEVKNVGGGIASVEEKGGGGPTRHLGGGIDLDWDPFRQTKKKNRKIPVLKEGGGAKGGLRISSGRLPAASLL